MESLDFPSAHIPLFLKIYGLLALLQGFNMSYHAQYFSLKQDDYIGYLLHTAILP